MSDNPPPISPDQSTANDTLSEPKKRGRPVIFDEPNRRQFCALLRLGCTITKAANLIGLSRRAIFYAANRDPDLAERIQRARLECQGNALRNIRMASRKNWRAAAWLLDRDRRRSSARKPPANTSARAILRNHEFQQQVFTMVREILPRAEQSNRLSSHIAAHEAKLNAVVAAINARRDRGEEVNALAELERSFPDHFPLEVQ
jgi:hypothetical protein